MEEVTHEMRVLGRVEGGWQLAASWPCPAYRHEILDLNSKGRIIPLADICMGTCVHG